MPRTFFRDLIRNNGLPITVEYQMEDETCACIVNAWPQTEEYDRLWTRKSQIQAGPYGNIRHFLSFTEEEREELDEIDRAIADMEFELTDAEHERMGAWLSETHVHESDDVEF